MVTIEPTRVDVEREEDGRILASVPELPGVMAYGATELEAVRKAKAIALQVLADMIESGEKTSPNPSGFCLPRERVACQPKQNESMQLCCGSAGALKSRWVPIASSSATAGPTTPSVSTMRKRWARDPNSPRSDGQLVANWH